MSDIIQELERLLGEVPKQRYALRLYVTGTTRLSGRAIANITALCESRLKGRYTLEVVDLYQHRDEARAHDIAVAPTLVKQLPPPFRRLIGDLSNTHQVLLALGLEPDVEVAPAAAAKPPATTLASAPTPPRTTRPRVADRE